MRINEAKPESQKRIEQTIAHLAYFRPPRGQRKVLADICLLTELRLVKSRLGDYRRPQGSDKRVRSQLVRKRSQLIIRLKSVG